MDAQRFEERRTDFLKAVTRLQEACAQPPSEFLRDAVIQRFEFCWELAWKLLRMRLDYQGIQAATPREVYQQALQAQLIEDGNAWTELQRMRNLTSHTYDEALASTVYAFIQTQGLARFQALATQAAQWLVA